MSQAYNWREFGEQEGHVGGGFGQHVVVQSDEEKHDLRALVVRIGHLLLPNLRVVFEPLEVALATRGGREFARVHLQLLCLFFVLI